LRDSEGKTVVTVPLIIRLVIVGVQPTAIVITIRVQQVQIAIRIVQNIVQITATQILKRAESYPAL